MALPKKGEIAISKDVVAVRGMAKAGPMVRYRATVKKMAYLGWMREARACRSLPE